MVPCYKLAVPTLGKHETHFSSPCSLNIDSVMYIATYVLYPQPTFRHKMAVEYINHTLFLTVHHNHIKIDLSNHTYRLLDHPVFNLAIICNLLVRRHL